MVYSPNAREGPFAKKLGEDYYVGVGVIMAVVSGVYVISEVERVLKTAVTSTDIAYLVLLGVVVLLVGGWIVFLKKDIDTLANWLDPVGYWPPEETFVSIGLAILLVLLLLTARYVRLFGVVYVLYTTGNLLASAHVRCEARLAIGKSRDWLKKDRDNEELSPSVAIYEKALAALDKFLLRRRNLLRIRICLALGAIGLALAVYGHAASRESAKLIAYGTYTVSIVGAEIAVMTCWRLSLFAELRPLEAARYKLRRSRAASRATGSGMAGM